MEEILQNASGRYSAYIIMTWDHAEIPGILAKLYPNKVVIFDFMNPAWGEYSYVIQDFEKSLYDNLAQAVEKIRKYHSVSFVCPDSANHPPQAKDAFRKFCREYGINGQVCNQPGEAIKGKAFLVVDDKHLIELVKRARRENLQIGSDLGIIAFNDYPMKEVLEGGITVISPDFAKMSKLIANSIKKREKIRSLVEPQMVMRNSL